MEINSPGQLAQLLKAERRAQRLTREQASAVCNVSVSFIRDAETQPEKCSLGLILRLIAGLGLTASILGWRSAGSTPS